MDAITIDGALVVSNSTVVARSHLGMQAGDFPGSGRVNLHAMWRACGSKPGAEPEQWLELASGLLDGLLDYQRRAGTWNDECPAPESVSALVGPPVSPETRRMRKENGTLDLFTSLGDIEADLEVATLYAMYLDNLGFRKCYIGVEEPPASPAVFGGEPDAGGTNGAGALRPIHIIESKRGAKEIKDVITRLKASKRQQEDLANREGREAGRSWAMNRAKAAYLSRLATDKNEAQSDWHWAAMFNTDLNDPFMIAHGVAMGLSRDNLDRADAHAFWETEMGDHYRRALDEVEFFEAFLIGAIDLWDEVKDQL